MPIERLFRILKYKLDEFVSDEFNRTNDSKKETRSRQTYEESAFNDPKTIKENQYFANLELQPTTDFDLIKKQYRKLMKKYHPDRFNGDTAKIEMARQVTSKLNEAYNYFEVKYK